VTPMLKGSGWSIAVRQIMVAYEGNPEGACRIPTATNFSRHMIDGQHRCEGRKS
jgi:hypothetical protein